MSEPSLLERNSADFLTGGGPAGLRCRELDWRETSLGSPDTWPQSLRSAVGICLNAQFPIAIYWGEDLSLIYNDAWAPILGKKHPWALGRAGREVWPEIWETIGPLFERVQSSGEGVWQEDQLLPMHRHGYTEECYFNFTFSPIRGENGRVAGIFNAVIETTYRVIEERRSRTLQAIAEALANVQDVDETFRRSARVLGDAALDLPFALLYEVDGDRLRLRGMSGASLPALLRPETLPCNGESAAWFGGLPQAMHIVSLPTECDVRSVWPESVREAVAVPLGEAGALKGLLVAGISPRRFWTADYRAFVERVTAQIENAVAEASGYMAERRRADALAEIDRAKTAFFSNVSHEFRTPLTLILGPLEDAIDAAEPGAFKDGLQAALRNAHRLLKLVNSLLEFSRMEAGRAAPNLAMVELSQLTADLASTFRSAMERAGLTFVVDCQTLDRPVQIDIEMWERVVLNLLSNAFKYTQSGSVHVRCRAIGNHAVVEVVDTGIGIPDDQQEEVFRRFHRVAGAGGRSQEGTGIGLALVRELVELMEGRISVTSTVGRGSAFRIELPLATGAAMPMDDVGSGPRPSSLAYVGEVERWLPSAPPSRVFSDESAPSLAQRQNVLGTRGARIVLADDNADMRDYVQRLLAPYYEVVSVGDGRAALDAATRGEPPELILADVMMPELDGFALLAAVRRDAALQDVPVILVSARAGQEAIVEGLEAGADDYLIKPFSARELLARVAGAIALSRTRKAAAERLRKSEQDFRAVHEASPDGFTILEALRDGDGRIVDFVWRYANPAAAAIAGKPVAELLGRRVLDIHPGNRQAGLFDAYVRVVETGEPWIHELEYQYDGIYAMVRLCVARIDDGVGISTVDVSERYRATLQLERADQQKDEFLAMLAHELRNPLAPIRNASEVLDRLIGADARSGRLVAMIQRQVAHLSRLVDDLLDVSRITRGRIELRRESADLRAIVQQGLETVMPAVEANAHRVSAQLGSEPLIVSGDVARMVQCVVNVLTNACRYTPRGGVIDVSLRQEGGAAVVTVRDSGIGIPPELLPHVFDLFVQGERAPDRSQGGLGIGLSVVDRLMRLQGGSVTASSEGEGRGSTFSLRFPMSGETPAPEPAVAGQPSPRRILIVDDNVDAAESLRLLLELEGHHAVAVESGSAALSFLADNDCDLVLLDIGLPTMDGYEVLRRIRQLSHREHTRVVALTGYGQTSDRNRTADAGFDLHLVKPVGREEIRNLCSAIATARR